MSYHTTGATRFDSFILYKSSYKKIGDHGVEVYVVVPKDIDPGKHPIVVRWHGGGLATGTAEYPDWLAAFWVPFLQRNHSIAVFPNYRLMPEHTGDEILEDIADFWTWFNASLPDYVATQNPDIQPDLSKVLVAGESAGGWCALQSVFTQPKGTFKACLIQYPVVDTYPVAENLSVFGMPIPPKQVLDDFISSIKPGTVITGADPTKTPERSMLMLLLLAFERWDERFGEGKHLMPNTRVEDATFLPPTYIIHGEDDTAVPIGTVHVFLEKAKRRLPDAKIKLVSRPGEHGFDIDINEENESWLKDLLKEVESDWLA